ncbi:MAG: PIG-L family deacetylase [Polaromonas sp.]|nr:PIG-L family deacetylase [Polaromonas sp.]
MDAVVMDRLIEGAGTTEADWQAWDGLHRVRSCSFSDLVPAGSRAVIVAPHPDDEVLAFGGLLAMLADAGCPVLVVAVTDGEASHPGSALWPPAQLGARRTAESCAGLAHLGVDERQRVRLRVPDGAVATAPDQLAARLGAFIRADDVLFSTWALDGHPDHEASAQAVARAARYAGCRHLQAPVWMWHWATPGDVRIPWQRMRRLALPAPVLARKRLAIAAHVTQLQAQDTGAPAVLTATSLARLLRADEYFFLPESGDAMPESAL